MRDEQEKAFALQKGALGQDRLRTWSETGKHGRMFITFIGLFLASYVRATRKGNEVLKKKFGSTYPVYHGRIYPSILFADLCCKNSLWQHQPGSSAAL